MLQSSLWFQQFKITKKCQYTKNLILTNLILCWQTMKLSFFYLVLEIRIAKKPIRKVTWFCLETLTYSYSTKRHANSKMYEYEYDQFPGPQASDLQIYLKRRLFHMCFPVNFPKFLRIPFSQSNFFLQATASDHPKTGRKQKGFMVS